MRSCRGVQGVGAGRRVWRASCSGVFSGALSSGIARAGAAGAGPRASGSAARQRNIWARCSTICTNEAALGDGVSRASARWAVHPVRACNSITVCEGVDADRAFLVVVAVEDRDVGRSWRGSLRR
eukprot:7410900-Pyramimonas_sp.AAC.1